MSPEESQRQRDRLEQSIKSETDSRLDQFMGWVKARVPQLVGGTLGGSMLAGMINTKWESTVDDVMWGVRNKLPRVPDTFLADLAVNLSKADIPHTLHNRIMDAVERGINVQAPVYQIRETVDATIGVFFHPRDWVDPLTGDTIYRGASTSQSERIARTVATAAHAQSMLYETTDTRKKWVALQDSRTRPEHAAANGQTVPVDGEFTVGGYPMSAPGDVQAPADMTVNCRCSIITLK